MSQRIIDLYEHNLKQSLPAKLQIMATAWQEKWKEPLAKNQKLLKLWASGYFDSSYEREHLINLIDRALFTIVPYLVEGNPKVLVETKIPNIRPWSRTVQLGLNFLIEKYNFAENVLIPVVINSMFGAGITRTIFEYDRIISLDDEVIKAGSPRVIVIDPANYIGDPSAKRRSDFVIEGDIYRLPTDYARDLFSKYADHIKPDCKLATKFGAEEISSPNFDYNRMSLKSYSTFIDIYCKDDKTIKTIMPKGKKAVILREVEWDGPRGGPYDYLAYRWYPDTPIPLPPMWFVHDLDVTMNVLAKTAREQAESQKNIVFIPPEAREAGKKIVSAKNLDVLEASSSELIKALSLGGVNPENYNWMGFAEDAFTKTGVNADIVAGRGAQAPTFGQEKMVFRNASRIIETMYNRFHSFTESILKKFAWGMLTDPSVYIPDIVKIPGVGELPVILSQADKVGDFYDLIFKIVPYSTQRTSPEEKYAKTMQFATQWLLPTMQLAAAQGASLDIPLITKIMASYFGLDNLEHYYKTVVPTNVENAPFMMFPKKNKFGQMSDAFGTNQQNREANLQQQQERTALTPEEEK